MKFASSVRKELGRQHTIQELQAGLLHNEIVVYRKNGNRRIKSGAFLKAINKIIPKIGVTRVADISYLVAIPFPVFQSCRPNYFMHSSLGQNSGSQGKGGYRTQAIISCLMETIEGYSCEPRNPSLIRASYNFLKNHKLVYPSQKFIHSDKIKAPTDNEPLMWTPAYCILTKTEVLIPAELIYFPFLSLDYNTRSIFPSGSNGLASGSSYLEATIHALYELIERNYAYFFDIGKIKIEAIYDQELLNKGILHFKNKYSNEYEIQFYALELYHTKKNMPLIFCTLVSSTETFTGWGLSSTVDISIDRAFSEAIQNMAVHISGTREDLKNDTKCTNYNPFHKTPQPKKRTLRINNFRNRVHDKTFKSLNEEYKFILKWLQQLGYNTIFVANLTRVGVDIPVVKVVIPGFQLPNSLKKTNPVRTHKLIQEMYPNMSSNK
ncbi:MAG: YcaO-like family protein [Pseudobdellovibrio sp.]